MEWGGGGCAIFRVYNDVIGCMLLFIYGVGGGCTFYFRMMS